MSCSKTSYDTHKEASEAIKITKKFSKRSRVPNRYYKCPDCGKWHLTHGKSKKRTRRMR